MGICFGAALGFGLGLGWAAGFAAAIISFLNCSMTASTISYLNVGAVKNIYIYI